MLKIKALRILTIFSILSISQGATAQSDVAAATNKASLDKLSIDLKKRAEAAQQHAKDVAKRKGWPTRKKLPDGTVIEIQRLTPAGMPVFYITNNAVAADTVSTDNVWPGGTAGLNLDGSGMTVGEWDGGAVLDTHAEFTGRVTQVDSATNTILHATHVAGTLIAAGIVPAAKGMAYAASLDAYDWNTDAAEMAAAAGNGLLLSNHSYGTATGWLWIDPFAAPPDNWWWLGGADASQVEDYNFGYYNADTQLWDQIAFDAPYYLIVKSAGNDRDDPGQVPGESYWIVDADGIKVETSTLSRNSDCAPAGYDCIPTNGTAKNILTVGAVDDIPGGYTSFPGPVSVAMSSFSGWGPTDDGRIKPDIVANGIGLYSPIVWSLLLQYDYFPLDGTSMAAPNVTGSLLLLQQHYQDRHSGSSMRSATLKALAIHTADEAGVANGPDYAFGWGLLNTETAARVITEDGGGHRIIEDTLADSATYSTQINVNEPDAVITATLVWTDPPGTPPPASLDPPDRMLVNDLDLRIHDASTTYLPWVLNPAAPGDPASVGDNDRDNVEQVVVSSGGPGAYMVEISHKGTLLNSIDQNFSLIISVVARGVETTTILESADFTSGLPAGWSIVTSGTGWEIVDPAGGPPPPVNLTGGTGEYAYVGGDTTDTELRTPNYDISPYAGAYLKFKSHFLFQELESASVDVSTDGGALWTTVWQRIGVFDPGPTTQFVDLSSEIAGESSLLIRFHYDTGSDIGNIWQIDDVEVVATSSVPVEDVCGNGYNLPANQWRLISLPCDPGTTNTPAGIFGDDISGAYGTTWIMYEYIEASDQYNPLAGSSVLTQGTGYWLYSLNKATLDVAGTATPLAFNADCPTPTEECFEIPLQKPLAEGLEQYNMLGHPLPYPVNWADVRIIVNGDINSPFSPSEALAKGYLSKIVYKYTGNAYAAYDDVTPGYEEGALGAYDGIWVSVLDGRLSTGDLSLLIPPIRSSGVITTALLNNVQRVSDTQMGEAAAAPLITVNNNQNTTWLELLNILIEEVVAAPSNNWKRVPPGLAKRDAHRNSHRSAIKANEEWYVRLIVEATDEGLIDSGNVLGQLNDSKQGYDEHDLNELSPFNPPYLTIVFPHPDWTENAGDYTSNFHPTGERHDVDAWSFEVRSDDPTREISLAWSGTAKILAKSHLIDNATGAVIKPTHDGTYRFSMSGISRSFTWKYNQNFGHSRKAN
jgi:hypothetical protein